MTYAYLQGAHLKRLIAWFKRITRPTKPHARKAPAAWATASSMPEIEIPDTSDDTAPLQLQPQPESMSQSFIQDNSWQPPACEAPSFDSSASYSAPSSCDTPTYTDP